MCKEERGRRRTKMKNAGTLQLASGSSFTKQRNMTAVLSSVQAVLALLFLFAGSMKLITPIAVLLAQMPLLLPGLFVRFIGGAEMAGALGLILPGLLRIGRRLTPLAACGLVIVMVAATVYNLIASLAGVALVTLVLGVLAMIVAYGRRGWGRA